ncbi:MAG: DUF4830 domain-containing protein [Oscillospiraceae bacterium]|nr:DUF4830 domain-containing protein [Oscillospiraceae bacterium]
MFVMTAKLSKPKLIAAGVLLVALIALIVLLLSGGQKEGSSLPSGANDAERAAYLASFGWSINAQPKETQQVKIPSTQDNKVFARYNDLQLSQGFDLRNFAGKEVTRFVYEILNYPEAKEPVYAGILIHDGRIIGGEITDTAPDGVIHGFRKPATQNAESSPTAEGTTAIESSIPTESALPENTTDATGDTIPTEGNEPC